jgi:GGDEF domain-containing protein
MNAQSPVRPAMLSQLDAARQMLESNQVESARGLASTVLKTAEEMGDRSVQGQALMALARHHRVLARFRRVIEDALTGIANRRRFESQLAAALAGAQNAGERLGN